MAPVLAKGSHSFTCHPSPPFRWYSVTELSGHKPVLVTVRVRGNAGRRLAKFSHPHWQARVSCLPVRTSMLIVEKKS